MSTYPPPMPKPSRTFSDKKKAEVKAEIILIDSCRSTLYLSGYLKDKENERIHDKLKKMRDKYQITISPEELITCK